MHSLGRQCEIQSKYLKSWESRNITLDFNKKQLVVECKGKQNKLFPIISMQLITKNQNAQTYYELITDSRLYRVKEDQNSKFIFKALKRYQNHIKIPIFEQQHTQKPKTINYFAPLSSSGFYQSNLDQLVKKNSLLVSMKVQQQYPRQLSYLKIGDWVRDSEDGGILFVNSQKKQNQGKIVKYVIKKILTTGSFSGVSFPTFAMKPESMLHTYSKAMGTAPLIFKDILSKSSVERIKLFNCFVLTMSVLFTDMDKPFNPTIGQTFQGKLAGLEIYGQQVSHHPPISAILLVGENYIIHLSLQLTANIGLNSAVGLFYGQICIQFADGGVIRGRMPSGILSGLIIGKDKFMPYGACFSYDPMNHIVSSYEVVQKDIMKGFIGKVNKKAYEKFLSLNRKQKYQNYKHIQERQLQVKYSSMQAIWSKQVAYDGKQYIDYQNPDWYPYDIELDDVEKTLPSDGRRRRDIDLRKGNQNQQSQTEKQRIQEMERAHRRLRQQRGKKR